MWDQNSNRKTRVEKGAVLAPDGAHEGSPDGMCTAGGRVREGNPPKLWSNFVQDPRDASQGRRI